MMEIDLSYDLSPNYDMNAHGDWARHSAGVIKRQPGMLEFRGHRQVFGTPRIGTSSIWRGLEDWERFTKSTGWLLMEEELRSFASKVMVNFREH